VSHYDFQVSREIEARGIPFYGLVMAAMRQADSHAIQKLRASFPETYVEFMARTDAPDGRLDGDPA